LHGGLWHAYADHRIATTGALIGLVIDGVEIDDIGSTSKTLPQFVELWHRMLGLPASAGGALDDVNGTVAGGSHTNDWLTTGGLLDGLGEGRLSI
ncbi:MAG: hypothetical protein GX862_08710, partial [Leucobacter sp.]|nr:hypothetical protein [Leucobacter sp.]